MTAEINRAGFYKRDELIEDQKSALRTYMPGQILTEACKATDPQFYINQIILLEYQRPLIHRERYRLMQNFAVTMLESEWESEALDPKLVVHAFEHGLFSPRPIWQAPEN